ARLKPDVLTVDIEMPRMDGLTFVKQLMSTQPIPVILISSLAQSSCEIALEGLRLGAVDVLAKPNGPYSVGDLHAQVVGRVRAAARAKLRRAPGDPPPPNGGTHGGPGGGAASAHGAATAPAAAGPAPGRAPVPTTATGHASASAHPAPPTHTYPVVRHMDYIV